MRLLVIGGSGLVGSNVVTIGSDAGMEVHATYLTTETDKTDVRLDKTDSERTSSVIEQIAPDVIVDTAAFHAVDNCESERNRAWSVNAAGTRNVAIAANTVNAHLIYLSTDYVFPGRPEDSPYVESDPIDPPNYYAETKYAGEQAAKIADAATILRPSVIYGVANSNFVTWALGELKEGNELTIVDDQISAPTYAPDLAQTCLNIGEEKLTGTYHATGPRSMSRYDFTIILANVYGFDSELITPISTEEFGQEAPRPTDSTLDSTQLYDAIDYRFRDPEVALSLMQSKM
ncbi:MULTISPECIES: dTDP-4-dehydrorhamnose reductase [Halorussus]|uniref:dTDP-4-dehydrorhamnose reductase n=1 Tax=Halorussus TaxID=1070314 RepID=UPI00209D9B58|nr:dTDP-4-dehydrorhamnose reductase [Halorussus vallis]USZ77382.1 dTDP-4-dehydrorhamnose reductase [Halorussus vallis]